MFMYFNPYCCRIYLNRWNAVIYRPVPQTRYLNNRAPIHVTRIPKCQVQFHNTRKGRTRTWSRCLQQQDVVRSTQKIIVADRVIHPGLNLLQSPEHANADDDLIPGHQTEIFTLDILQVNAWLRLDDKAEEDPMNVPAVACVSFLRPCNMKPLKRRTVATRVTETREQ